MQLIVRIMRTAVLVLTLLATASSSAAAASTSANATSKVSVEAGQTSAKDCWQAECGSGPVPWKLVLPICYAHEGSQYVPQCQDIYP
jgi:hypothetical protein